MLPIKKQPAAICMSVTTDINKSPSLTGILATNVIFSNKRKINSGTGVTEC